MAVFSGMIGVTFFGLFLTPVFYLLLRSLKWHAAAQAARREDFDAGAGNAFSLIGHADRPPSCPHSG